MADKITMELFPGAKNLPPGEFLRGRDLRDIQVGVVHGPTGKTYNRLAVPWAGAAYTLVGGNWVKITGRDGAMSGSEMEQKYPNLVGVWRSFASAQGSRDSNPGSFEALVADLRRVAQNISPQGRMNPNDGISLQAQKQKAKGNRSLGELPGVEA